MGRRCARLRLALPAGNFSPPFFRRTPSRRGAGKRNALSARRRRPQNPPPAWKGLTEPGPRALPQTPPAGSRPKPTAPGPRSQKRPSRKAGSGKDPHTAARCRNLPEPRRRYGTGAGEAALARGALPAGLGAACVTAALPWTLPLQEAGQDYFIHLSQIRFIFKRRAQRAVSFQTLCQLLPPHIPEVLALCGPGGAIPGQSDRFR